MTTPFYKPRPIDPKDNPQMKGLRWSLRVSVAGWIIYGAFAYAFADVSVIPAAVQSWMVLIGSVLIVAGAESNTIATSEAALSKLGTDRISRWDFAAVVASLIGGICTPLITFSTRQPGLAGTWWRKIAVNQGPLILGIAGILDFYGAVTEMALSTRDYVIALGDWLEENQAWEEGQVAPAQEPQPEALDFDPSWPEATRADAKGIWATANGEREGTAAERVAYLRRELHKKALRMPDVAKSTLYRWADPKEG